jgi:hypothetical protein
MKFAIWGALLVGLLAAGAGCTKSESSADPSSSAEQTSDGAKSAAPQSAAGDAGATQTLMNHVQKKNSLEGRWIVIFYQRGTPLEVPAVLINVERSSKDKKLNGKVMGFGLGLSQPISKSIQVTEKTVHLIVELSVPTGAQGQRQTQARRDADILVELRDGVARGNAQLTPVDTFLVAMAPTELENIQELKSQMLAEAHELQDEVKETKPEEIQAKIAAFVKKYPQSPLAIDFFPYLLKKMGPQKLDEAAVGGWANDYIASSDLWGSRQGFKSRIEVAESLLTGNVQIPLAIKQVDTALSRLNEETIPFWKSRLEELRRTAVAMRALTQIQDGSADEKTKAAEVLREREKAHPYDPLITYQLAHYDEEHGKKEAALHRYAELDVLPMLGAILTQIWQRDNETHPSPHDAAERLWKEQHGGKAAGLDKYFDTVYSESMPKLTDKPVPPRPTDPENRIALCELFTGTSCPPCVGADVAFAHLSKTYAPSELILLQYHQHIPQPDPLANEDSLARFHAIFREGGGTPTFVISGLGAQSGGFLGQVPDIYKMIRNLIDVTLKKKTTVKIRLTAQPKGSSVAVTATAEGSLSASDAIRMRMAIVEDRIAMKGTNGIREHEMVVRSMPGGSRGIEMKDGKFHYEATIDVKSIRQKLDDYLKGFEEQSKHTFPSKPLDLSHLHFVAFVQNDQTGEVYQAAMIPLPSPSATAANDHPQHKSAANSNQKPVSTASAKGSP